MFDAILNTTKNRILAIVDDLEEPVYFSNLLNIKNLPVPYLKFFEAELNRQIYELKLLHSGLFNFNFEHPVFSRIYSDFLANLNKIVRLDRQALTDLVFEAVKFRLHFLILPRKILLEFVYKNSLQKNKSEILLDLEYFADYIYLIDELKNRINGYKSEFLSRIDFQILISQIDNHFFTQSSISEILSVLIPLFEFFNLDSFDYEKSKIPVLAFYYFFKDKELTSLSNFFLFEYEKDPNTLYSFTQIEEILSKLYEKTTTTTTEIIQEKQTFYFAFDNISSEAFLLPVHSKKSKADTPKISGEGVETLISDENTPQLHKHKDVLDILNKIEKGVASDVGTSEFDTQFQETFLKKEEKFNLPNEIKITTEIEVQELEILNQPTYEQLEDNESVILTSTDLNNEQNEIDDQEKIVEQNFQDTSNALLSNLAEESSEQQLVIDDNEALESVDVFPPISEFISDDMRQEFIEELFYTLEDEYENLVKKVDDSKSLEEALNEVKTFYKEFGIFEEMPIAKQFLELIHKKFKSN